MWSATVWDQSQRGSTLPCRYLKCLISFNSCTVGLSPSFKLPFPLTPLYCVLVKSKETMNVISFSFCTRNWRCLFQNSHLVNVNNYFMKGLFKKCQRGGPICDSALVSYYWRATQTAIITYLTAVCLEDSPVTEHTEQWKRQQKSKHERPSITETS